MMAQYLEVKAEAPDALLFYRMGDFYELFFDDAVAAASALDIALTKRGQHLGKDIPMCGVPHHAAEGYLLTLIRKGFRVAIAEQMETPEEARKRGHKAVVRREITRLVTPGTLTEDTLLDARRHNFLASYAELREQGALAWADISTGEIRVITLARARLAPELARLAPSELLVNDRNSENIRPIADDMGIALTGLSPTSFDSQSAEARLCALYKVQTLDSFAAFTRPELAALGGLLDYLELTQRGKLPLLHKPQRDSSQDLVQIDTATRRNLELTQSLSGTREGALLACIDRTLTAAGARLLERRLAAPSRRLETILARQDAVRFFHEHNRLRTELCISLKSVPDIDRALSRLALDRAGPRDIAAIRNTLIHAIDISETLASGNPPALLAESVTALTGYETLLDLLDSALVAEPPYLARDGGFIAPGHDADLDEARQLRDEGRSVIARLQVEYQQDTGISSLKIKHNNVLGYFIEVTSTHAERMQALSERYVHRQTTANQLRFTTLALSELETKILNAGARALELEKRHFENLRQAVLECAAPLSATARALAEIDLATALADLARARSWAAPTLDTSRAFAITGGRHPVVEQALARSGESFIANDCDLSAEQDDAAIWLLTGPNMAGKSTFLRQNALIAILAQMGSFVPAQSAHIGLVSQIFSRVGASDDLARGRSTFMVEMVETAAILNQADAHALIILDEIGRGTATYDGLSIAWATLEHLHNVNKSRALFATHYHEMTALAGKLQGVQNATVSVKEWEGEVIFLHEVKRGAADRSYGVQVARLAGLPDPVIARAREILAALEEGSATSPKAIIDDLPLFAASPQPLEQPKTNPAIEKLARVLPDELTPKQALELIYELKSLSTT